MSNAERFMSLFQALDRSHGTYSVPEGTLPDSEGKLRGKALTVPTGPTLELWQAHLDGEKSLGVVPICSDSSCVFGALDIDNYLNFDLAVLLEKSHNQLALPLVICRSKSGGAHCLLFSAEPVPAKLMRARLAECRDALGLPSRTEIFPKQEVLTEANGSGGWLNCPYFGPEDPGPAYGGRFSVMPWGVCQSPEEFLDYAEAAKLPASWFSKPVAYMQASGTKVKKSKKPEPAYKCGLEDAHYPGLQSALAKYLSENGPPKKLSNGEIDVWLVTLLASAGITDPAKIREYTQELRSFGYKKRDEDQTKEPNGKRADVATIADYLTKKGLHFACGAGKALYTFKDGVYVAGGEAAVQREVKVWCKETKHDWTSSELADRVVDYILIDAPKLWERPPLDTINLQNGLIDVATRTLRPHSPDFLSPVQLPVKYEEGAKCPAIEKFCGEVLPEDSQDILWYLAAWLMLPNTDIQKAVLLLGVGSNGKSVLLNILADFIGEDNLASSTLHSLEGGRFATCALVGKLANICADLPTKVLSDTSIFKRLLGGDLLDGERKFGGTFSFRPYSRLIFSANVAPRSEDSTHGFFRRWLVVPFNRRIFSPTDADTVPIAILRERLAAPTELSGLLNRALDYIEQIQKGFIPESESMREAWLEFKSTTDPLTIWLDETLIEAPDGFITKTSILDRYNSHRKDGGNPGTNMNALTQCLLQWRPGIKTAQRTVNGVPRVWCYTGVGWQVPKGEQRKLSGTTGRECNVAPVRRVFFIDQWARAGDPVVSAAISRLIQG